MTPSIEQIKEILANAPDGATHYVHADNEYWDLARNNDHPKVWDDYWIAVDYDSTTHMDIFSASKISDLRTIAQQAEEIERLRGQAPKWISVEDELPREFIDTVLVSRNKGNKSVMAAFHNGEDFISLSIAGNHAYKGATHWLPLPQPPKESEHE